MVELPTTHHNKRLLLKGYRIPLSQDRRVEVADFRAFLEAHGMPVKRLDEHLQKSPEPSK